MRSESACKEKEGEGKKEDPLTVKLKVLDEWAWDTYENYSPVDSE